MSDTMFHTSNPAMRSFRSKVTADTGEVATVNGVINKTAMCIGAVILLAALVYAILPVALIGPVTMISALATLVFVFIVAFRKTITLPWAITYAVLEGVFLGAVSKFYELNYPGIIALAVLATFITAGATLAVFKFGKIRVGAKFRKMVFVATLSFAAVAGINILLMIFGVNLHLVDSGPNSSTLSWVFSLVAVALATFNLVVDFDDVLVLVENRMDAKYEWAAAFSLTVTLVWLYIEMLRLLSRFYKR